MKLTLISIKMPLLAGLIFLLSINLNAQNPYYRERINIFISTNENGAAYDKLKTKEQRDSMIYECLLQDWVDTIRYNPPPYEWVCANYSSQLSANFHGFTSYLIYNGYDGFSLDSIYINSGTLKDNGRFGLPVLPVNVTYDNHIYGHAMNGILTGDNALNWYDWNFIEPQFDQMYVQPGQAYMPGIFHGTDTADGHVYISCYSLAAVGVAFRIENGKPELFIDPNIDLGIPNPLLILSRDTVNPFINVESPINDFFYNKDPDLSYAFEDSTLRNAWYSLDDGITKDTLYRDLYEYVIIGQEYCGPPQCDVGYWYDKYSWVPIDSANGEVKLLMIDGNYDLLISAIDYFNLETLDTIHFTIDKTLPAINVSSPVQGSVYKQNDVSFNYVLSDANPDLGNSYYILNGVKTYFTQPTDALLITSNEGLNTLEIHLQDLAGNTDNRTITYSLNTQTGIDYLRDASKVTFYPNPVRDHGVFKFDNEEKGTITIELFDITGKLLWQDIINSDEMIIDFSQFSLGIITYKVRNQHNTIGVGTILKE